MSERRPHVAWVDPAADAALAALGVDDPGELDWQDMALCAQTDPDEWFPEQGESNRNAKRVCARCPVWMECLEYALATNQEYGVWGGLDERERKALRSGIPLRAVREKTCTKCGIPRPLDDFHTRPGRRSPRRESRCKSCRREQRVERWRRERAA